MKRYKAYENEDTREAAALKYDVDQDRVPRITALGRGYLADRMVREAEQNRVQVVRDDKVSHVLHRLSVGDEIPESLYRVVAEILVFVYRMDGKFGPGHETPGIHTEEVL
jgi:flagellar biosynthesis protein